MNAKRAIASSTLALALSGALFLPLAHPRGAELEASGPPADIPKQIEEKNQEIRRLEAEAEKYRATLEEIEREATSLQSRIQALDRTIKRLEVTIRATNAKVAKANLEISELGGSIRAKELAIVEERNRLGYLLQALAASDQETPLEILMKYESLASFFNSVDSLLGVQRNLQMLLTDLRRAREDLRERKRQTEAKRLELAALLEDLADQKALQVEERRERSTLLAETRNQERRYQELLAEIERKREALQQEINALESGLRAEFDRSLLPAPGSGVLGWPLPEPIFITQYFGRTAFARSGGYNGKGHNGIDLRAAVGTPVFSSDQGRVRAVGDTDAACRRASYGRWLLIDHPSNLSTLYAHLSLIKVRPGDAVNRGTLLGYSGRTGYATGPHLHLSVFARQAVSVGELRSRVCGRTMTLPLSPFGGYLNPLEYL